MMLLSFMMISHRVGAVVSHILAGLEREHLKEADLVRICFVVEAKASVRDLGEPDLPVFSIEGDFI